MFGNFAWKLPTSSSSTLPSGPVRPFQKVRVTFPLGTAISPAAAGLLAAGWAAGAVVAAGWAAGAAAVVGCAAGFDSAGLVSAGLAGVDADGWLPPQAWSRPLAATATVVRPSVRRNARRWIIEGLRGSLAMRDLPWSG